MFLLLAGKDGRVLVLDGNYSTSKLWSLANYDGFIAMGAYDKCEIRNLNTGTKYSFETIDI